ncbi:MAG: aminotransferase class I/II-fold pyridoxal phosphate-dependent enzyme [Planctomycetota bacterium]
MLDHDRFITDRLRAIDASGIRRVFDLAATMTEPINLSIGQPHFDVPDAVRQHAADAIANGINGYTQTQGIADLRDAVWGRLADEFPQTVGEREDELGLLITSGVSGGLLLALMTCVGPGDEVIVPDPYFVMYKHLVTLSGATPVFVDTYPDFQLTAERIDAAVTDRTKLVLFNTPSNPSGVVAPPEVCREVAEVCERRGLLLLSDEIYDEFCYEKTETPHGLTRCPSPMTWSGDTLLMRGFSKTYAMTGWRLGYAVGPKPIVEQMTKLQQYSFVCAPSMVQVAGVAALELDMAEHVEAYRLKRDRVIERLSSAFSLTPPGGAFYALPEVPASLGLTATQFVERAAERDLLIIPGSVFSQRDTHFRLSYACHDEHLDRGLDVLLELAEG